MQSTQALRERRTARAMDARAILDKHHEGQFPTEAKEAIDTIYAEIDDIDTQLVVWHKQQDVEAGKFFDELKRNGVKEIDEKKPQRKLLDKWMRRPEQLTGEDWASIRNVLSTTTGSQGGFTVPVEVATEVANALKVYGGMRQVSQSLQTSSGADINYPTSDGTAEIGELIAQNATATALDPVFGVITLATYKFSSKIIAIPFELLQDTVVDMEAFIRQRIVDRLGRITNQMFTTGTGTGQPNGLVTAATSGKVGIAGQTLTVIYDDLVDLVGSVDPAYRQAAGTKGFMMNDASVKVLRKIKDTTGRPIWTPGYEAGLTQGIPDNLLGWPVYINQDMAVMAANAKSILFGNYNYYIIRDVMDLTLFRFTDSAYTKLGQVGFLAWMRAGGNYVDVGGGVKFYQNSAT